VAYVERDCSVVLQGRRFRAGGAVVTATTIVAYPSAGGILADWHGRPIGTWRKVATWLVRVPSWRTPPTAIMQIRAVVNGVTYTGRGQGPGMIFRGRAVKTAGRS
jgi:hypothetical protein